MTWTYQDELERLGHALGEAETELSEQDLELAAQQYKYDCAKQNYQVCKAEYNNFVANMPDDSSEECNRG